MTGWGAEEALGRPLDDVYHAVDERTGLPAENPVHPTQMLATVYHTLGIDPHTMVLNHLNQPRELVQAEPVTGLFG